MLSHHFITERTFVALIIYHRHRAIISLHTLNLLSLPLEAKRNTRRVLDGAMSPTSEAASAAWRPSRSDKPMCHCKRSEAISLLHLLLEQSGTPACVPLRFKIFSRVCTSLCAPILLSGALKTGAHPTCASHCTFRVFRCASRGRARVEIRRLTLLSYFLICGIPLILPSPRAQ